MKSAIVREGLFMVAYPIGGTQYDVGVGHLAETYVIREMHIHESILLRRWGSRGACVKGCTVAFILLVYCTLSCSPQPTNVLQPYCNQASTQRTGILCKTA
jgi:hypothetical protein